MDPRDQRLIDKGFYYVAKCTYVEAAVRALMSTDHRQQDWARSVLDGLGELPNREVKNDEQTR